MAKPRLNQIIAVVSGQKPKTQADVTALHRASMQESAFFGLHRRYEPIDDEGERLPSEEKIIQASAWDIYDKATDSWSKLWDAVLTQEMGNRIAAADIVVDGKTIAANVPVTFLLFLEKQLLDVRKFAATLPVNPTDVSWKWDKDGAQWQTEPSESLKSKKVPKTFVKAEATDKHPAQVDVFTEDVYVGRWYSTRFSKALSPNQKMELLQRIDNLIEAIKVAREAANSVEVDQHSVSNNLFTYIATAE